MIERKKEKGLRLKEYRNYYLSDLNIHISSGSQGVRLSLFVLPTPRCTILFSLEISEAVSGGSLDKSIRSVSAWSRANGNF